MQGHKTVDNELSCTFEDFKRRTMFAIREYRKGTLSEEEFNQLDKMVVLSYLNISNMDAPTVDVQAPIVLQLYYRETGRLPMPPHEAIRRLREFTRIPDLL